MRLASVCAQSKHNASKALVFYWSANNAQQTEQKVFFILIFAKCSRLIRLTYIYIYIYMCMRVRLLLSRFNRARDFLPFRSSSAARSKKGATQPPAANWSANWLPSFAVDVQPQASLLRWFLFRFGVGW